MRGPILKVVSIESLNLKSQISLLSLLLLLLLLGRRFETGFLYKALEAVLELVLQTRLALNSRDLSAFSF